MKKLKFNNFEKGFTIIEVVLVLAIAGLIFLMLFLALPALQKSQRDTQRKRDVALLRAALEKYRSNNKGSFSNINDRNYGVRNIKEGPLVNYLDGVSSETEKYWLGGKAGVKGSTFMSLSSETNHKTIGVMFDAKCHTTDDSTLINSVGGVVILGSLETGPQANSKQFGRFNYCLDL